MNRSFHWNVLKSILTLNVSCLITLMFFLLRVCIYVKEKKIEESLQESYRKTVNLYFLLLFFLFNYSRQSWCKTKHLCLCLTHHCFTWNISLPSASIITFTVSLYLWVGWHSFVHSFIQWRFKNVLYPGLL